MNQKRWGSNGRFGPKLPKDLHGFMDKAKEFINQEETL
jgi:hypothetical protein